MADENRKNEEFVTVFTDNVKGVGVLQGCFMLIGVLALLLFSTVAIFLLTGFLTINSLFSSIGDFFGQPVTAQVTTTRTIINGIQPLGQLVSVSVEVAQADINVAVDSGGLNLCNHDANHVAQGALEAGVDITGLEDDDVLYDEASDTYTISLPAPNITSCRIEYIRQYERSGGNPTCGYDWDSVRLLAQYEATTLFASQSIEAGILSRAEREATIALETFISTLTGSNVEIMFQETDADTVLPPSCQPQLPNGWQFDTEFNAWLETQ